MPVAPVGYPDGMTDYSEHGAIPIEDAATDDPPTVDEVQDEQRRRYPEQAATSSLNPDSVDPRSVNQDRDAGSGAEGATSTGDADSQDPPPAR